MNLTYTFSNYRSYCAAVKAIVDDMFDDVCSTNDADMSITCHNDIAYDAIGNIIAGYDRDGHHEEDDFLSDAEADADVLASAGHGTDEDYEHNSIDDGE